MTAPHSASAPVKAVIFDAATVLIDVRHGGVHTLIGPAARLLTQLADGADIAEAAAGADLTAQEAGGVLDTLVEAGVLTSTVGPAGQLTLIAGVDPGPSWGTRVQAVALAPLPPTRLALKVMGAAGLIAVLIAGRAGRRSRAFARHVAVARLVEHLHLPAASRKDIADTVAAVRWIGRRIPARVACLEESSASVLALALRGRAATWCHGVAPDPIRLHAWVADLSGQPVAEPEETSVYTVVLRIPDDDRRRLPSC